MRSSMVNHIWTSIADAGRDLLRGRLSGRRRGIEALCRDLLSTRGEASGAALAREVVETFRALPDAERLAFFELLAQGFEVDHDRLVAAAEAYKAEPALELAAGAAPRHRVAAARAVPAHEHGAERHPLDRPDARAAAARAGRPPRARPSTPTCTRC